MISEKQLISDCQKGIKSSQYELVKRYSSMLLAVSKRYVKDSHTAQDVVQEAFIKIFKHISSYKNSGSFEAWMRRITARCALTWIDKSVYKKEVSIEANPIEKTIHPDVFHMMEYQEILKLIKQLPMGYRTVFNLNVIEGYSHKEIAELLDISEGTSRSQLARAKGVLQKQLEIMYSKKITA